MKTVSSILIMSIALFTLMTPASARRHSREAPAEASQPPSQPAIPPPDDTAKFLAGLPISRNSPLAPLTQDPAWQEHSAYFEKAFAKLITRQLTKLHTWQNSYLPESKQAFPVVFYMFSGPDL